MPTPSAIEHLTRWAEPVPEIGPAVYRLTSAPDEHKHTYHIYCPWSVDQTQLLLTRYNRVDPMATICVMDTATGAIREIGQTNNWECHTAARPVWLGDTGSIVYPAGDEPGDDRCRYVIVRPDGSNERILTLSSPIAAHHYPTSDGKWLIGTTDLFTLFPGDTIAPRHDKGLLRVCTETGDVKLIFSIEDALALLPGKVQASPCHLYMKMVILHPRTNRILFNLTNTFWDMGAGEPRVRSIISIDIDGSNPCYVGEILHHPNWHMISNNIIANAPDCNNNLRLVIFDGNGELLPAYVPLTKGSGHPTISPDGSLICTDASGPEGTQVIFCDPRTGHSVVALDCHECGGGYASFKAIGSRSQGETIIDSLRRAATAPKTWQTQRHPAWSRDGSAVLVNSDRGDGSQLYVIDVQRTLAGKK